MRSGERQENATTAPFDRVQFIRDGLRRDGASPAQIARALGISPQRVGQIMRGAGLPAARPKPPPHEIATIKRARELWTAGLSAAQIGHQLTAETDPYPGML